MDDYKMHPSKATWNKINDFLLTAGSAESITELGSCILKEISSFIFFDNAGVLIELDEKLKPSICDSVNSEKKWNDSFNDYYYKTSTSPDFDKNIFFADYDGIKKHHGLEYYNDFLAPQRINYCAGFIVTDQTNKPTHTFVFNRTKSERMFREEELTAIRIIQQHISNYYRMLSLLEKFKSLPVLIPELEANNGLLSKRESEITSLLLNRTKPAVIAKELKISTLTVRKHIQNIYGKLNITDRKQLMQKIYLDFSKKN